MEKKKRAEKNGKRTIQTLLCKPSFISLRFTSWLALCSKLNVSCNYSFYFKTSMTCWSEHVFSKHAANVYGKLIDRCHTHHAGQESHICLTEYSPHSEPYVAVIADIPLHSLRCLSGTKWVWATQPLVVPPIPVIRLLCGEAHVHQGGDLPEAVWSPSWCFLLIGRARWGWYLPSNRQRTALGNLKPPTNIKQAQQKHSST